ncbi:MAG: HIT family protein [Promethearchaeia archaeon]
MAFEGWLRAQGKLNYVMGKDRPKVDCILCAVRDDDERVISLKFYQDDIIFVCLNLFPYNPAHMMVVPNRHVIKFEELNKKEILRIFRAIQGLQMMLNELYQPHGYNIGFNQGSGGASIEHLHCHLVPRYKSELGYIDIIGKTRIMIEGLEDVKKKMKNNVDKYLNEDFFKSFK